MAQFIKNTDRDYKCVRCGSPDVNIIRESADPRLKCLRCNFMFDASQAQGAVEAGALPSEPIPDDVPLSEPIRRNTPTEGESKDDQRAQDPLQNGSRARKDKLHKPIPRSPNYVFISKDRSQMEFCTEKNVVTTTLRWKSQDINFDLFELTAKTSTVKVNIQ